MGCKSYPDLPARGETAAAERKFLPGLTLEQHGGEARACTKRCSTRVEQRPKPLCSKTSSEPCPCCRTGIHSSWAAWGEHAGAMRTVTWAPQGAEGKPLPRAFREATFPMDFLHPVGSVPLSATRSFTPSQSTSIPFQEGMCEPAAGGDTWAGQDVPEQWPG